MVAAAICIVTIHCTLYDMDVFLIVVTAFPQNSSIIVEMINKWKYFFEIQDGGDHHVEFWLFGFFD